MKLNLPALILSSFIIIPTISHAQNNNTPHLTGYWQNFYNVAETPVQLTNIPSGYHVINVAFGDMEADGTVKFTVQGPPYASMSDGDATFKNDIKTLQTKGVKVILSLGGQNGYFQINGSAQKDKFVSSVEQIIKAYNFDGLDYDFEGGLTAANASYPVEATKTIKQDFSAKGKTLLFTLAPETIDVYWQTFPNGKYDPLIKSGLINLVQVQMYNSGCMPGSNPSSPCYAQGSQDFIVSQADSTIQAWKKNGISDAEAKYSIGLPATTSAAGGGYVDPAVANKALTCLKTLSNCGAYKPTQAYPGLTNIMTWSINWDAKNAYGFEKAIQSGAK